MKRTVKLSLGMSFIMLALVMLAPHLASPKLVLRFLPEDIYEAGKDHPVPSLPKRLLCHLLLLMAAAYMVWAYSIIENSAIANTSAMGEKLAKMMKIPGMSSFFLSLWDPISRKMFGESCGFQNVFYPREKGAYRMDIVACPYNRYFTELGCPELTKIFCENDERTYGNLPGLQFIRTSTLGKGGERCDFYLKKVKR